MTGFGAVRRLPVLILLLLASLPAVARDDRRASGDVAGLFDYYVLSLSWSPEYCATTRRRDEPQCTRPYAFVAHGLWPQNERGWPQDCTSRERVSETTINRLLPIMPSRGLIIHEWRKHGTCSGLGADGYFAAIERSYRAIRIPDRFRLLPEPLTIASRELRRDLLAANPQLQADGLVLLCSGRYLKEARICLDRRFAPRRCGPDLRERCGGSVVLRPVR